MNYGGNYACGETEVKPRTFGNQSEGKRTETLEVARAEAERIRKIGQADAEAISFIGKAQAEAMKLKAAAYANYGTAGVTAMIAQSLPQIAAEVSAPLSKVSEIVIIGGNKDGGNGLVTELVKTVGTLNPAVKSLTGIDLAAAVGHKLQPSSAESASHGHRASDKSARK
ncbi:unnamed protein product [Allacma fusca]|uniref:Flotillin C-terminal domain-containing protein n=1 Tax=Allacma fusca TaxID=39272 RepID=A0A8J2PBH7_9HEXA|nr:unnamed protein product [Allacma fusca]